MVIDNDFKQRYKQLVKLAWRAILWIVVLICTMIFCVILEFNQTDFEKDYKFTQMQWETEILPTDSIMTAHLTPSISRFNFGFNEDYITFSAYYGITPPKLLSPIYQQIVYLKQATLPQPLTENTYRLNELILIKANSIDKPEYEKIFIKEGTIQSIVENHNHSNTIEDTQHQIGKRIITGTDFVKNKKLIENNFRWFFICSKAIVVSILILLGFFSYKFHKRLNILDKIMLVIISSVFIFYIYQSSLNYFNALT